MVVYGMFYGGSGFCCVGDGRRLSTVQFAPRIRITALLLASLRLSLNMTPLDFQQNALLFVTVRPFYLFFLAVSVTFVSAISGAGATCGA